jgi:hypothetical protein
VQRDSRHYFQRPDAGHVEVDPNATSLTGLASRYWLNRQNGNMIFNAALGLLTPKFDVNDVGFQTRADVINAHVGGGRKWTQPGKHRKYQELLAAAYGVGDFGGNLTGLGFYAEGYTQFVNNHAMDYVVMYFPQTRNNRRTRGGPLTLNKPGFDASYHFETNAQRKVYFYVNAAVDDYPDAGTYDWNVAPGVEWKPASNVILSVAPQYARSRDDAQYLDTIADALATGTFGQRYVFARLDQTQLSAEVRLNWTFSPTLSVQLYLQPLLASGKLTDYKELARPNSYDFRHYALGTEYDPRTGIVDPDGPSAGGAPFDPDRPSFNGSLRGNAVLRWEFMPGSAFYLAWTQQRTDDEPLGSFDVGPAARRLFRTPADNILLAKVTYYLGV